MFSNVRYLQSKIHFRAQNTFGKMGTRPFSRKQSGRDVHLIIHPRPDLRLEKKYGDISTPTLDIHDLF